MNNINWDELFRLAKKAIIHYMKYGEEPQIKPKNKKTATFVTLTKNGMLRGCIGSIKSILPLEQDVVKNAIAAAFYDPRFPPLEEHELKDLEVEISILGELKRFHGTLEEFLEFLRKHKPKVGVVIKHGLKSATFLPEVWETLPNEKDFMMQLALKAGMSLEELKNAEYYYYFTQSKKKKWEEI